MKRFVVLSIVMLWAASAFAGDWLTFGHDPQRSGWARDEHVITRANAATLVLQWKVQLDNAAREMTSLTAPIVVTGVGTSKGVRDVVYVVGANDAVFALDAASGQLLWKQQLQSYSKPLEKDSWLCPQGVNATPVADKKDGLLYVIASDGKLHRLDLATGEMRVRPFQFVPPYSKNWSMNLVDGIVYTTISQGCGGARSGIYALDVRDPVEPVLRVLYTGRGGAGGVWGRGGAVVANGRVYAMAGDGPFNPAKHEFGSNVVAATAELKLADYFTPPNWQQLTQLDLDLGSASPVWFTHRGRAYLAGGAKEGLVYLLDANRLGGDDHASALYTTPLLSNDDKAFEAHGVWGGLSTWSDESGATWVYVPAWGPPAANKPRFPFMNGEAPHGSVMAFRVNDAAGSPSLEPVWMSPDMAVPEPVVIANGVVFALSNGENTRQTDRGGRFDKFESGATKILETSDRFKNVHPAELFALDATTGKLIYRSGDAIQSWTHFSAPVVAAGKIFVVDHDSRVYAFAPR